MASKNEKRAAELGLTLKQYKQTDEYKNKGKSSSKSSKKTDKSFKKFLKEKGMSDYYDSLSGDMQDMVKYNYEIQSADQKDKLEKLDSALKEAEKQADPYWKSYLIVAQDEVNRAVEDITGQYTPEIERNQRTIDRLKQNLSENKEFLNLEQQATLANLTRDYEVKNEQLVEGAAEAGLTFSTKRKTAEQRMAEEQQGMVESTTRRYEKQLGDLEKEAEVGQLEAQKQTEELQKRMQSGITDVGRRAEAQLGTENLPAIEGYKPLGDISGELYEQKARDIEARKQAIYGEKVQQSLTF